MVDFASRCFRRVMSDVILELKLRVPVAIEFAEYFRYEDFR